MLLIFFLGLITKFMFVFQRVRRWNSGREEFWLV